MALFTARVQKWQFPTDLNCYVCPKYKILSLTFTYKLVNTSLSFPI